MTAHPEVLVQLRNKLVADAEGFNAHRRLHESIRVGEDVKVRRSPQAAACRKRYAEELGRPHRLLGGGSVAGWYTALEARKGKPGDGTMLEPTRRDASRAREAEKYWQRERPPYAVGESYRAEYSAVGKAYHTGKDSTEARSPERQLIPDMSDRSSMSQPPCGQ